MPPVEEMSRDELQARAAELAPFADEYEFLRDTLYLLDEGFVTMDERGRLWPAGA